ncbi:uncharacterized protein LOC120343074 [Styela clava]
MLSSLEASSNNISSIPMNYTGSMSALLFDDSMEKMDVDKTSSDVTRYLEEYIESSFNFAETTSSFSASPCSDHTSVSRTSSDEGSSNKMTPSYTVSTCSDVFSPTDSKDCNFQLNNMINTSTDEFPYEDVLSLENALEEAVGDSLENVGSVKSESNMIQNLSSHTSISGQNFTMPQPPNSNPPISNAFPKVSHRVVISPTTTLVLSDDVMRKKHRPLSTNSKSTSKIVTSTSNQLHPSMVQNRPISSSSGKISPVAINVGSNDHAITSLHSMTASNQSPQSVETSDHLLAEQDDQQNDENVEWSTPRKSIQAIQKNPLPPEGYKITRYPLKSQTDNREENKIQDETTDIINELRHQLQRARMEVDHRLKEVEEWRLSAQQIFDAARKIRAQMELEKSRADRAESKIAQLTAHFRSKAAAKARAKSIGSEKSGTSGNVNQSSKSPNTADASGSKTSGSPDPIILSRKRRRTVPELDDVTKSLASWLMSQPSDTKKKPATSAHPRSVSESVFGFQKPKDELVYSPQINSGVRLALRAKVCSARADTLNTAQDLIKQTKLLLVDLPTIPESSSSASIPGLFESRITMRNRWSSVDSVHSATTCSTTPSSGSARVPMSHSLSESSLQIKKS